MATYKPDVRVQDFVDACPPEAQLKVVAENKGMQRRIREPTVNRPGLALAGFTRYFASKRVQALGSAEHTFIRSLDDEVKRERYRALAAFPVPCFVFGRHLKPDPIFLEVAEEARIPVLRTPMITMNFINQATLLLETLFAPTGSEMGSMVDILGIGVIVKGESGVGKSEAVLALVERGYSLVSDDITRVTLRDNGQVIGFAPEMTRNHMEVRGIGIINVAVMFGVKSVRQNKRVDLIVYLKPWESMDEIERVGIDDQYETILGERIPAITLPIRPGRDIARLIEVAAFQTKLKSSGFNAAKEFNSRLIEKMTSGSGNFPPR